MSNNENTIILERNAERLAELKEYEQTLIKFGEKNNHLLKDCREEIMSIELENNQLNK